jgi:mevalonate kinase
VTGRGKVILLGEHAVVYGHPALAGAIGLGVTATASPSTADRLEIPAWEPEAPWAMQPNHPIRLALAAVKDALGIKTPFAIVANATVPPRAGLGSSAALAVALVRALAQATDRALDDDAVEKAALAAERVFHGTPSGIDVALATPRRPRPLPPRRGADPHRRPAGAPRGRHLARAPRHRGARRRRRRAPGRRAADHARPPRAAR